MAKKAIIVESPAKTRTLASFVGSGYKLLASMGGIRDLPESGLGVDVENGFEPSYVTIPAKKKVVAELKRKLKGVDDVYLATDPDREGEAIAWHLAEVLKLKAPRRIYFNEITKEAVLEALSSPGEIDGDRVNAQQARRVLDRLVGYQISPLLIRRLKGKSLSAGRVQSVALRLICDREREIGLFEPREYWSVEAQLTPADREEPFTAKLITKDGEEVELPDEDATAGVVDDLRGRDYVVSNVTRKQRRRNPYPPFITSTLQQQAARKLRFSARQTMVIAQQLYEGVELGPEGSVGLITYMRTDSTRIADSAKQQAEAFITKRFGKEFVGKRRARKAKKGVQDAHEAVRPSSVRRRPKDVKEYLTEEQLRLYRLIWRRFVASQMAPAVFDVTTVDIAAGPWGLRVTGSIVKFPGYQRVYEEEPDEDRDEEDEASRRLPELHEDEPLRLLELTPEQHFTKPPPRYSEASLVRELEQNGIGRPSTYAPIIEVLRRREYVSMDRRRFVPTPRGLVVCDYLVEHFPDLMEVEFTATMEAGLDTVEQGERDWVALVRDFHDPLTEALEEAKTAPPKRLDEKCPECGAELVQRMNVRGKYAACEKYPGDCEFTRPIDDPALPARSKPEPIDEECPECGSQLRIMDGQHGKFVGCSGYPKCKYTRPVEPASGDEGAPADVDVECAECGKPMVARNGRRGRFLGCSGYPGCRFTMNLDDEGKPAPSTRGSRSKPELTDEECEKCGKPMAVRRGRGGTFLGCSGYPKCRNTKPASGDVARRPRPKPEPTDEKCEECGSPMVIRSGKRGKFLGCSKYPKCRHTRDLNAAASGSSAGGD
jgi:DNA topoisomerase-1